MSENNEEIVMPCGCRRAFVEREVPDFDEATGAPVMKDGAFVMKKSKELEETFCPEHSNKLIEHQQHVQRQLAGGPVTSEEALRLSGVMQHPLLGDGSGEDE